MATKQTTVPQLETQTFGKKTYKLERKRKHRNPGGATRSDQNSDPHSTSFTVPESDTSTGLDLYVQAYEADIVRGPAAKISAASLEAPLPGTIETGGALIRWEAQDEAMVNTQANDDRNVIWVDRYVSFKVLELPGFVFCGLCSLAYQSLVDCQ
ncbi:hypothetical protein C0993_010936 [Termitomyces sp. T159_Od127]|nr:hypothetical protein C0993_010936 [Termitomyces sp. T159_Od127]